MIQESPDFLDQPPVNEWFGFVLVAARLQGIYYIFGERMSSQRDNRYGGALDQDGYLVIGAMESLNGICPQFESKRHLRSAFYQVKGRT